MSRFIDSLDRVTKSSARSMGFSLQKTATSKPRMQIIACMASGFSGDVEGADALVLKISKTNGAKKLQKLYKKADVPCGAWYSGEVFNDVKTIEVSGADFIIFSANNPVRAFGDKSSAIGRVIEVDSSLNIGLLRAIGDLPLNAVFLTGELTNEIPVNWNNLMLFKHISSVIDRHLLVAVPATITPDEIQALWDAGVNGVIIEVSSQQPADDISALRNAMDDITFAPRQKQLITRLNMPQDAGGDIQEEEQEVEEEDE
ncbi:hypothetical protein ACFLXC_02525 [Chloroflexota bacterium]